MKVLIMGLGLYEKGSGISAAKYFIEKGDEVLITDLKTIDGFFEYKFKLLTKN